MRPNSPSFNEPDLAQAIEALPPEALDTLPFGCIRLDAEGAVVLYSATERRLSGSGDRPRIGLHFFSRVAPCMDNAAFRGRIEKALASGTLDLEFGWVGDFDDTEKSLQVRVQSASGGGCWIFLHREDA